MRLDGFLSQHGFGSRTEVQVLVRRGRVRVDGLTHRDPGLRLTTQVVAVDNRVVEVGPDEATLVFHKPLGLACSRDPREAPLVDDLVPEPYQHLGIQPAGRLDRDTSGLLIMTSDGGLIHRLTNPKRHLPKRYRIQYAGTLGSHAVERVRQGIALEGDEHPTRPAELILEGPGAAGWSRATLILAEGRYHQVRRMIAALGGEVMTLHRDRIGCLDLPDDVAPGTMRPIRPDEAAALVAGADGPATAGPSSP